MRTATRYGGRLADYLTQTARAQAFMRLQHERMIAAGFQWDGADGYIAPPDPVDPADEGEAKR
ncbi:hypothetical protein D3C71_1715870 [compost metagenome]